MKKGIIGAVILLILSGNVFSIYPQGKEFRGVWVAWAGSNVPSRERIKEMMEDIAAHNMNTVYVDVWRFGYPYFRSKVNHAHTGYYTDPALPFGRDVLAEMIVEGHRVGLHVEAWFEYGFVVCQGNNDVFYQRHPDWFARKRNGTTLFNGSYQYRWLSHCNRNAQQFLIDLCQEVALNYDIDGIELDRIRYPELDCGYDSATVELYKQEHDGEEPPQIVTNSEWMRWRADKLTDFVADFYDSLKAIRPDIPISNAPIVYSYGYENFCQDWRPWINEGYLDVVSPQVYRSSNAHYSTELSKQMNHVTDRSKFYPGLTSIANSYLVPTNEIVAMIRTTRNRGLDGHVIWFYDTIADDLPVLKNEVYQSAVEPPGRPDGWRRPPIIINETSTNVVKSAGWQEYTTIPGYNDGCLYVNSSNAEWIEYSADIDISGWYEIYVYNIYHWNGTPMAPYEISHKAGTDTVHFGQNMATFAEWQKLGDYYMEAGTGKRVVRLSNETIPDQLLFADAIMLLNTNRLKGAATSVDIERAPDQSTGINLHQNYPNPFNPVTNISFHLNADVQASLKVYDVTGKAIMTLFNKRLDAGDHTVAFDGNNLTSGIYFYTLKTDNFSTSNKMLLVK